MTDSLNLHVSFRKLIVSIQYVLLRLSEKEYTEKIVGMIGDSVVAVDEKYFRLTEVDLLLGNPSKAQTELNWKPEYDIWAWWPI